MNVSLIAVVGKNGELGFENKLLWRLSDDLKRFKKITLGHPIIMGRKTYESIGKPLPQRKNIVVTRSSSYQAPGCAVVNSIEDAFRTAGNDDEIFVIGGAEIYKLALPHAKKIYLTVVDAEHEADAYFPEFDRKDWTILREETHEKDEKHPYRFVFTVFARKA